MSPSDQQTLPRPTPEAPPWETPLQAEQPPGVPNQDPPPAKPPLHQSLPLLPGLSQRQASLPTRKRGRSRAGRFGWMVVLAALAAGLVWAAVGWALSARKPLDVLAATATRGELVITVVDRGELESSQSVHV